MNPTMNMFKAVWMLEYFPTHDHVIDGWFPIRRELKTDYWIAADGHFTAMAESIRLP